MAQLYDSDLIRTAARSVRQLANELDGGTGKPMREAIGASEALKGRAAEALRERLEEMKARLEHLNGEIETISDDLERYAGVVETVSQALVKEME